jgi:hypothetical protein
MNMAHCYSAFACWWQTHNYITQTLRSAREGATINTWLCNMLTHDKQTQRRCNAVPCKSGYVYYFRKKQALYPLTSKHLHLTSNQGGRWSAHCLVHLHLQTHIPACYGSRAYDGVGLACNQCAVYHCTQAIAAAVATPLPPIAKGVAGVDGTTCGLAVAHPHTQDGRDSCMQQARGVR